MKRTKITIVAALTALSAFMLAPAASAQQDADGLVVQIDDTSVNVTVPINAAWASPPTCVVSL